MTGGPLIWWTGRGWFPTFGPCKITPTHRTRIKVEQPGVAAQKMRWLNVPRSWSFCSLVTLGLYLIYWYHAVYKEWSALTGRTPTGNGYVLDLVLTIVTCGVWGIYVDYRISQEISAYRVSRALQDNDTTVAVLILDIAAYVTVSITYLVSSALQQDLLNDLRRDEGSR